MSHLAGNTLCDEIPCCFPLPEARGKATRAHKSESKLQKSIKMAVAVAQRNVSAFEFCLVSAQVLSTLVV